MPNQNFDPEAIGRLENRLNLALSAALETVKIIETLRAENADLQKRVTALEEFLPSMRKNYAGEIAGNGAGHNAVLDQIAHNAKPQLEGGNG